MSNPQSLTSKQFTAGMLVLSALLIMNTACAAPIRLTVTNRTDTDLTIVADALDRHGQVMRSRSLGSAPADQDTYLQNSLILIQDVIGWTVVLKGEDASVTVLWQRSWAFEEFLKLKDVGWKITLSPETNQLPGG